MKFKLAVLDYDGTIVGKSGIPTERVKAAIKKTVALGVKVSISTGRSAFSLISLIKELHLDVPHVFLAGALVFNPIKDVVLLEDPIEKSAVLLVDEFAGKNGIYLEVSTQDKLYYNLAEDFFVNRRKRISNEPCEIVNVEKLLETAKVLNMRFILTDDRYKTAFNELKEKLADQLNFQIGYPHDEQIEVVNMTSLEVSKVSALRHLCQYLKISPEETLAIGDSPIDLPLIENVGLGIAMGNAKDEVKIKAKEVTASVDQDGVAVALEKYVIGNPFSSQEKAG